MYVFIYRYCVYMNGWVAMSAHFLVTMVLDRNVDVIVPVYVRIS